MSSCASQHLLAHRCLGCILDRLKIGVTIDCSSLAASYRRATQELRVRENSDAARTSAQRPEPVKRLKASR